MSTSQQELPPSLPPTYHESIRGAPPRQQQQQQQPYHGSPTGWTPPTGSWEPSPGPSSGAGYRYPHHLNNGLTSSHPYTGQQQQQQPPLPPRAPTAASTSSYQPTSAPQRQSDSRSNSSGDNDSASFGGGAGGGKDEKKRSSFFFGSGGRNKDKGKDREKEREKERERERRKEQEDDARSEKEKERRQRERVREEERERERERETAPSAKYTYASPEESEMRSYLARIPAQAQKALAPLKMQSDTKDITGVFAVEMPSASSPNATSLAPASNGASTVVLPTAVFESTGRNDIDITLYLRPSLESLQQQQSQLQSQSQARSYNPYAAPPPLPYRNNQNTNANVPLEILAKNKKGRILLSLPDRIPNRPLRIICTLDCEASLPRCLNVQPRAKTNLKLAAFPSLRQPTSTCNCP